eukprot:TRINITY_DN19331_c0_g1_i1.p1 TRINITY_DN19331_c0_g1~~TRINITY_DN19331_c0_g1_i1.p1  ORF type:complete len:325 (-),score=70.54 TRINITY_DN19331_c0_g1_i1:30-1004(-)
MNKKCVVFVGLLILCFVGTGLCQTRFVSYIDKITGWWPPSAIAKGIGLPGYATSKGYNVINFSFWTSNTGPVDVADIISNPLHYVSTQNPWGQNNTVIRQKWMQAYHSAGIKVLVSAFGSTDFPTTEGVDPVQCGEKLAQFVIDCDLDGVDLDWEDNAAMEAGKGEAWLISITRTLRSKLPSPRYIISHAPQAPYFMGTSKYPAGGYITVNNAVGSLIDFYNIQFYNQDSSAYSTFNTLFQQSDGWASGTAVRQIAAKGVPMNKLVVGKPVTQGDVNNSGYVDLNTLVGILKQGKTIGWNAGVMGWQYADDTNWMSTISSALRN